MEQVKSCRVAHAAGWVEHAAGWVEHAAEWAEHVAAGPGGGGAF